MNRIAKSNTIVNEHPDDRARRRIRTEAGLLIKEFCTSGIRRYRVLDQLACFLQVHRCRIEFREVEVLMLKHLPNHPKLRHYIHQVMDIVKEATHIHHECSSYENERCVGEYNSNDSFVSSTQFIKGLDDQDPFSDRDEGASK